MDNLIEFKQGSINIKPNTKEVFVVNQSAPVYVKKKALLTGGDIVSVEVVKDKYKNTGVKILLSSKGLIKYNFAARDSQFPMLVFFLNGKSIQVIHWLYELNEQEGVVIIYEDNDFAVTFAALINSGIKK